jgi:Rho GTPase-activating protein RGD1
MAEEGYLSSAWESGDQSDLAGHGHPQLRTFDSAEVSSSGPQPMTSSPQPRSSIDSAGRSSTSKRQESPPAVTTERRDILATIHSDSASLVEPSFDENVLRALCDLDVRPGAIVMSVFAQLHLLTQCGVPLLLDRIKQSMVSCRVIFFSRIRP